MIAAMSRPPVLEPATRPLVAGDTLDNPITGEFGVLVKAPWEGEDRSFEGNLTVQPGGAVIGEHVHHNFDERFAVTAGQITFRLDGSESVAGPGDVVEIPSGHWHDWWNAGAEEAIVVAYVSEGDRFLQMIETIWGLARDGHTNSRASPTLCNWRCSLPSFATSSSCAGHRPRSSRRSSACCDRSPKPAAIAAPIRSTAARCWRPSSRLPLPPSADWSLRTGKAAGAIRKGRLPT